MPHKNVSLPTPQTAADALYTYQSTTQSLDCLGTKCRSISINIRLLEENERGKPPMKEEKKDCLITRDIESIFITDSLQILLILLKC